MAPQTTGFELGEIKPILALEPSGRGGDPRAPANALGIRHVTFAVQGIDDVLDRLRAHGAELVGELWIMPTAQV